MTACWNLLTLLLITAVAQTEPVPKNFYATYTATITNTDPQNKTTVAQMYSDKNRQTLRMDVAKKGILTITIFDYPNKTLASIQGTSPVACHKTGTPSWNPFTIDPFEIAKYKGVAVKGNKIVNVWADVVFLEDIVEYSSDAFDDTPVQAVFKDGYVLRWENIVTDTPDPKLFELPSICV